MSEFDQVTAVRLGRHYGRRRALHDLSFTARAGDILGLLGPNGAGKSTLLSILGTLLAASTGHVEYGQQRAADAGAALRARIGMLGHDLFLYPELSARENLVFFASLYGLERPGAVADAALERAGLASRAGDLVSSFSGGMRQRVAIALATVFQPSLIIADEPTTALDVFVQRGVLQTIKEIQAESGNTVLLVTHDIAVHANVADRLMIMYAGRIAEEAPTENIFAAPLHPYTQHLVSSLPVIGERSTKASLKGAPPNLANPPTGCRFHPRCPLAVDICRTEVPEMREVAPRHRVACHLVKEGMQ